MYDDLTTWWLMNANALHFDLQRSKDKVILDIALCFIFIFCHTCHFIFDINGAIISK